MYQLFMGNAACREPVNDLTFPVANTPGKGLNGPNEGFLRAFSAYEILPTLSRGLRRKDLRCVILRH